jgi:amino acid transporter
MGAPQGQLQRHFGLLQATALNMTMIVGAGVFITIPLMLLKLPGPYAVLGWLAAGALILVDCLIWSELGAALPGSGGSYLYLLECYGRTKLGRLMAFLFIWQFLISGPLELGSGLIALDTFSQSLPWWTEFNSAYTWHPAITLSGHQLGLTFSPGRFCCVLLGLGLIVLLYRNIRILGRLTVALWLGVLAIILWIGLEGLLRFDSRVAFDFTGSAAHVPANFLQNLGQAMILALYAYLGYYNICYIGEEVRDPGRTIPRAIFLSAFLVVLLFVGLHLAMLGVVPWQAIPTDEKVLADFSLPAEFMRRIYPGQNWPVVLVTLLLMWSCLGSAFAGLLGYSRIPFGAARQGHFFAVMGAISPRHQIPHLSLLLVGGLMLFWSFFDLGDVISALITTRILEQFIGQVIGLIILRRTQPDRPRPFRIYLYPIPCGLALVGWLYVYIASGQFFIVLGLVTMLAGFVTYLCWANWVEHWPFPEKRNADHAAD